MTHIDTDYFINKLKLVIRDIKMYTPNELARELERLSQTAKEEVTK